MRWYRVIRGCLAASMLLVACGADENPGDPAAFCELLRDGVGLPGGGTEDLDALVETAPPEIASTVNKLANTVRSLDEIPDSDLEELFSAAFDPDAVAAREELQAYAVQECGSTATEQREPSEDVIDETSALANLETYIEQNFGTTDWASNIGLDVSFEFGRLESVSGQFRKRPASDDDPLAACNALAVYLYEINDGGGEVTITQGETVLAGRTGPDTSCVIP